MRIRPLRFRNVSNGIFFSDDAGGWFLSDETFLQRYAEEKLLPDDIDFLRSRGLIVSEDELSDTSFAWRWANRIATEGKINYLMLVPTLRCDLQCEYCQVSRVAEDAKGFDWSEDTLEHVIRFIDSLETDELKIEFQGGEPTLRIDLLQSIRDFCRNRFSKTEFVVCTNLQRVDECILDFFDAEDTYVSTSIDGGTSTHTKQRTKSEAATNEFFKNLEIVSDRIGLNRISALPTIDPTNPPNFNELVNQYKKLGIQSIYLRPVNYQGFARKNVPQSSEISKWLTYHDDFIDEMIEYNQCHDGFLEDFYFSLCLKRFVNCGHESHVNIRNPNLLGTNYCLIDFDGTIYPTDESRMLARIGLVDLSIGHVKDGIDVDTVGKLNSSSMNNFDPDCIHCAYQPFCGTDVVDDISRYGRIDLPREETWFCKRQMAIFDKIVELIYSDDERISPSLAKWAGGVAWPSSIARRHL